MAHDVQVSFIRVLLKVCKKNKGLIIIISLHVCNVVQSLNWLVTVQLYRYSVHLHFHCTCGRGIQAIWQVWRIYTVWHGKNQTHFTHNYFRNVCTHGPYLRKNWELVWREDVKNLQRRGWAVPPIRFVFPDYGPFTDFFWGNWSGFGLYCVRKVRFL